MKHNQEDALIDALRDLLSEGIARTQEDIRKSLQEQGFEVNQSKISRLLRKLSVTKTMSGTGETTYRLPWEPEPPSPLTTISHLVVNVVQNETLIVVQTTPGSASLIARLLDYQAEKIGSIGSIAGDDTILIVPKSIKTLEETSKNIKQLLFAS